MANVIGQSVVKGEASKLTLASKQREKADFLATTNVVVGDHLREVESTIVSELQSESHEVESLLQHSRELGGKRLRPALVLLAGKATGAVKRPHILAAAALEMIHLATLVHDDVLDGAKTRRHSETAHAKFGTRLGVLLGDFLFTHAFSLGAQTESIDVVKTLSSASNLVCEGEMKQNAWQGSFDISEKSYIRMVGEKTGELCAAGCAIGAILSGADNDLAESFKKFGLELGVAFQIIDDVLDLVGQESEVGKTLGTDLVNRKATLPVIHALSTLPPDKRNKLMHLLNAESVPVGEVISILQAAGSIDYARAKARSIAERALLFAEGLPASDASVALAQIGHMILQRTF